MDLEILHVYNMHTICRCNILCVLYTFVFIFSSYVVSSSTPIKSYATSTEMCINCCFHPVEWGLEDEKMVRFQL